MYCADGRTRPTWKSCEHTFPDGPRCPSCGVQRFLGARVRGRKRIASIDNPVAGYGLAQSIEISMEAIVQPPRARGKLARDYCSHGHRMSPENTGTRPDGYRTCKTCRREYTKAAMTRSRERRKLEAIAA